MELEARRICSLKIQLCCEIPASPCQFNASQGGTKPHLKRPPVAGISQCAGETLGGVSQENNPGHPRQQAALPEYQMGMKMADNCLFDLRHSRADRLLPPEKRQRCRIMAKQKNPLARLARRKGMTNLPQMLLAQ